jgi:hypothetical protein
MTLLAAAGLLLSVSGDRGGYVRRPQSAARMAPTSGDALLRRAEGGAP